MPLEQKDQSSLVAVSPDHDGEGTATAPGSRPSRRQRQLAGLSFEQQQARLDPAADEAGAGAAGPGDPAVTARAGLSGPARALPHLGAIQRAFGRHDVGRIAAHLDEAAAQACADLGVRAYALGEEVAFGGAPDLQTVAHEAAHVVAQRLGTAPPGQLGRAGDPFERRADQIAAQVVQGRSVEHLLEPEAGGAPQQALQFESLAAGSAPQKEMQQELARELQLIDNARAIVAWATAQSKASAGKKTDGKSGKRAGKKAAEQAAPKSSKKSGKQPAPDAAEQSKKGAPTADQASPAAAASGGEALAQAAESVLEGLSEATETVLTGLGKTAEHLAAGVDEVKKWLAPGPLLEPAALLADSKLRAKLRPKMQAPADLEPTFQLMVDYGVVKPEGTAYRLQTTGKDKLPATARLEKAGEEVAALDKDFQARFQTGERKTPVVETAELDELELSADRPSRLAALGIKDLHSRLDEFVILRKPTAKGKAQKEILRVVELPTTVDPAAESFEVVVSTSQVEAKDGGISYQQGSRKKVKVKTAELEKVERVRDGGEAVTQKQRDRINEEIAKLTPIAEKVLKSRKCYRTFSKDVLDYIKKIRDKFSDFRVGTYPTHSWGEFSADFFLGGSYMKEGPHKGFYDGPKTVEFYEALEQAAVENDFGWQSCYNDQLVADEVNAKFSKKRVKTGVPGHGPDPGGKLHVHVDFKPAQLAKDQVTGYTIDARGRVVPNAAP
ncbi:MAG: DUF4157 domain-containing protein [Myxococcota bacterium]|nr:DUF4157 domain-containing protein [Myxococcota bacterium]